MSTETIETPSPSSFDAAVNFTYGDMLRQLQALSGKQLNQQALWIGEGGQGKVCSLWVLDEAHANPSGEGLEPASGYAAEELEGEEIWPAGLVLIQQA